MVCPLDDVKVFACMADSGNFSATALVASKAEAQAIDEAILSVDMRIFILLLLEPSNTGTLFDRTDDQRFRLSLFESVQDFGGFLL